MKRATDRLKVIRATDDQDALILALADESPLVVEAAAERIRAERAADALLEAYVRLEQAAPAGDPGCRTRLEILRALGRLEAPQGEQVALRALRTVQVETVGWGKEDTATSLRAAAAGLLANLRVAGALVDLALLLHDSEPNAPCSVSERPYAKLATRAAAARAIGALGDPAGVAVLAVKLTYPEGELHEVLSECMDGLAALRSPRAPGLLEPWLEHVDPYLATTAATALAATAGEQAVPALEAAADRVVAGARESLVYALGSIRSAATRAALARLVHHPDTVIRKVAKELV